MYLKRVFAKSPIMGVWCCLFIGLTLVLNVLKLQITPFFLWGMFSANAEVEPQQQIVQVVTMHNDTLNYTDINTANTFRTLLVSSAFLADDIAQNGNQHPVVTDMLPKFEGKVPEQLYQALRNFLADRVVEDAKNTQQLAAFKNWQKQILTKYYGIPIQSVVMQTIECQSDGYWRKVN